jgi:hypothetical protein
MYTTYLMVMVMMMVTEIIMILNITDITNYKPEHATKRVGTTRGVKQSVLMTYSRARHDFAQAWSVGLFSKAWRKLSGYSCTMMVTESER